MADESAKGKLTLSGKSTLTLKNVGKSSVSEGRKMVQVEVRKKRTISSSPAPAAKVEIDEATAQKLRLIAEAKEHEAKRSAMNRQHALKPKKNSVRRKNGCVRKKKPKWKKKLH